MGMRGRGGSLRRILRVGGWRRGAIILLVRSDEVVSFFCLLFLCLFSLSSLSSLSSLTSLTSLTSLSSLSLSSLCWCLYLFSLSSNSIKKGYSHVKLNCYV